MSVVGETTVCRVFSCQPRRSSKRKRRGATTVAQTIVWDDPAPWRYGARSRVRELATIGRTPGSKFAGGHRIRVTPVPIPNTEVKPDTADGTAWETVWESRSLPALFSQARCETSQQASCTRRRHARRTEFGDTIRVNTAILDHDPKRAAALSGATASSTRHPARGGGVESRQRRRDQLAQRRAQAAGARRPSPATGSPLRSPRPAGRRTERSPRSTRCSIRSISRVRRETPAGGETSHAQLAPTPGPQRVHADRVAPASARQRAGSPGRCVSHRAVAHRCLPIRSPTCRGDSREAPIAGVRSALVRLGSRRNRLSRPPRELRRAFEHRQRHREIVHRRRGPGTA